MKRSSILRKLTHLLKSWEGSKLDGSTSKEILDLLENEGMSPPGYQSDIWSRVDNDYFMENEWEPEND